MRNIFGIVVGITVLAFAACGSDNGPPSVSTSKDNVCAQVAAVACYDMYQCCTEGEIEKELDVSDPRTQDECQDDIQKACEREIATQTFSLSNQRVTFDASVMNTCLQALIVPGGTCATVDTMLPWTTACMGTAWVGAVADGSTCDYTYECASVDSECAANRTCTARPGNGEPCGLGCASNLYCSEATDTCAPLLAAGAACTTSTACMTGLFCDLTATTPTCTALRMSGQTCSGDATCVSNDCLPGTCAGTDETCYTSANCEAHCSNNTEDFCTVGNDDDCGEGTCSVSHTECDFADECTAVGDTCVFPNQCVAAACMGTIVCADAEITVDYCTGALEALPVSP